MNFKSFLLESIKNPRLFAEITFQNILNNLDYGYVDYTDDKTTFSVGKITKNSSLNNLYIIIRKSNNDKVSYGNFSQKDGNVIVIDTTKYPKRANIDSFLSGDTSLHKKILQCIEKHSDNVDETGPKNDNELRTHLTNKKNVEAEYDKLLQYISTINKQYKHAVSELGSEMKKTVNYGKQLEHEKAMELLKYDYFGKSAKEFISKLASHQSGKFLQLLDKQYKQYIESRLTDYWESLSTAE